MSLDEEGRSDFGEAGEKLPLSKDELVDREVLSPNWDEREQPISMVVIHYTEMQDKGFAIERLCDPEAKVSAHYLIDEPGEVVRLVPEEKRPGTRTSATGASTRMNGSASVSSSTIRDTNTAIATSTRRSSRRWCRWWRAS